MDKKKYVIYSFEETTAQDEPLFWNNEFGWTSIESATIFTEDDTKVLNLPLPKDSKWITKENGEKIVGSYRASFLFKD
jgi:hypothetical protein